MPERVTPMVLYLASQSWTWTHRSYSAVNGRYDRVFVGVAAGWSAPGSTSTTKAGVGDGMIAFARIPYPAPFSATALQSPTMPALAEQ